MYGTDEKCPRCGSSYNFTETKNGGTLVRSSAIGTVILKTKKFPFVWVYFHCSGCGYLLVSYSTSKSVYKIKTSGFKWARFQIRAMWVLMTLGFRGSLSSRIHKIYNRLPESERP